MAGFRTRFDDLPLEFAIFPLPGVLLLPRGRLPLNIFEPRYVAMIGDSFATGRMFAMIQPDGTLPETPNGPSLHRIGCLGRLTSFSETEDGRYLITLTGLIRFSIASEIDKRRGYRRVVGDFSRYQADMNQSGQLAERTSGPLWFRKMDKNRDGEVSRREFLGESATFATFDKNGDGFLDLAEAVQIVAE